MLPGEDVEDGEETTFIMHNGVPVTVVTDGNIGFGNHEEDPNAISQNNQDNSTTTGSRRKRFITAYETKRWTEAIVPYDFEDSMVPKERHEIEVAMSRISRYTCIRFVPWVEGVTRIDYNLDHDGYILFVNASGSCSSPLGNSRNAKGQKVKCCGRSTCVHEIGHSLGLSHENQDPRSLWWLRVNYENIKKDYWKWYRPSITEGKLFYKYDLSSIMGYSLSAFNSNGRHTMTLLFPELTIKGSVFYALHEVSDVHNCAALKCPGITMDCRNDGYPTVVDDECSCNCPYGLDRSTDCKTTLTAATKAAGGFPGGSYAMLAPKEGCPGDDVFVEGEVTHWSDGGSKTSSIFNLKGSYLSESTTHHFCVTENYESSVSWPAGEYCIHRVGGVCPEGFDEGYIQFDDVIRSPEQSNSYSDPVPDGVFVEDTRFYFCCKDDGFASDPILLSDTTEPFVLYRYGSKCPIVSGMFASYEYFTFYNYNGNDSIAQKFGAYPKIYEKSGRFTLYYCYYTPLTMDCGGMFELDEANSVVVITSPGYPNLYQSAMECNWVVTAPEDSWIVLDFDDFDIEADSNSCEDALHIRHSRLGQPALKYCGDGMKSSVRSIFNTIGLTLTTNLQNNRRGFNATARLIRPEDSCYDLSDKGKTYRGTVNYTRSMERCLPWASTTSCEYHAFNEKYLNVGLDENYCRNPGDGLRPWCYIGYNEDDGCLRNYCDVCQYENIYDAVDYCDLLVDESLCELDNNLFRLCAKTCMEYLPESPDIEEVVDVTCGQPPLPSDGEFPSIEKDSYQVGETVDVQCETTGFNITTTCLTDGSWDIGNHVCGVCQTGWSPHNGFCYKYFEEKLNYNDATAKCAEFDAVVAPTPNQEEFDFILKQRKFMEEIWLGGDDKETEGNWVWQDGTDFTWDNWKSGDPSSKYDCGFIDREDKDSEWDDTYCSTEEYNFVCRAVLLGEDTTGCNDRRKTCVEDITAEPSACSLYPEFAQYECPCTCGLRTATTCTIPTPGAMVEIESPPEGQIPTGEYVTYRCVDDTVFKGGNLRRACLPNGQLTGIEPICIPVSHLTLSNNEVELKSRHYVGSTKDFYTGLTDEFRISKDGEIKQWRLYSKYPGHVGLQVWREEGTNSLRFIGQNLLETEEGLHLIAIDPAERIQVKSGDLIGVYYGDPKGGIPKSSCSGVPGIKSTVDYGRSFVPGWVYETETTSCGVFSLTAMVGPSGFTLNNDVELIPRGESAENGRVYTGMMPEFLISQQGEITEWNFYASSAASVSLQVLRQMPENSYELVGQNTFVTEDSGSQVFPVDVRDRIQVEVGDVIGVWQEEGVIPFDNCDTSEGWTVISSAAYASPSDLSVDQPYAFDVGNPQCRRFSISALIQPRRTPGLNNHVELIARLTSGSVRAVYTGLTPDLYIRQTGEISEWHFYSTDAGEVTLQVWRTLNETSFRFVGQNTVQTLTDQVQIVPIDPENRIPVEEGDLLGVLYVGGGGTIRYSYCSGKEGLVMKRKYMDPEDFVVGEDYTISSSPKCRRFSLSALVVPV